MAKTVEIFVRSEPDKDGKQSFDAHWTGVDALREGQPRAQGFYANLREQVQLWKQRGYEVKVIERERG